MIHVGDCLEVMRTLDANSVDSIVTDPPYGLGFMGKAWDHGVPGRQFWMEALRVAKPGSHIVAFGGTRTFHRLAVAIEDAGWEIRDTLMWVYGSGFPKSHNGDWGGTALKPAWEPIILARKPLTRTVEANWREHGTGALNIDGCRVETGDNLNGGAYSADRKPSESEWVKHGGTIHSSTGREYDQPSGRWPANLVHDGSDEVVAMFPQSDGQAGTVRGTEPSKTGDANCYGEFGRIPFPARGDSGSAARFFYCAKADRSDRNDGLDGMPVFSAGERAGGRAEDSAGLATAYAGTRTPGQNNHPTVKPTDLMRWLCRLVTPPGGLILDPFTGSGSTGRGAILEGFRFIGIELSEDYAAIAEARIAAAVEQRRIDTAQIDMFMGAVA